MNELVDVFFKFFTFSLTIVIISISAVYLFLAPIDIIEYFKLPMSGMLYISIFVVLLTIYLTILYFIFPD